MSTVFTYESLKTSIKNHAEDQGVNFANNIDTMIRIGEDRVIRELPLSVYQAKGNVTITQGTQATTKPTGALAIHNLYYLLAGERKFIEPRPYSYCLDYAPNTTQAPPKYFAEDYSATEMWLAPAPNLSVTAEAFYLKRPNSIITDINGTWISLNAGDLLLAACMIAGERYNIDMEKMTMWLTDYPLLLASAYTQFEHLLPKNFKDIGSLPSAK